MVNFRTLAAEICWRVWAPQQISVGFACWLRYSSDVTQWTSTKLCTMFGHPSPTWVYYIYIHFWGLWPSNGILPAAKFTLLPSLAFSYIGSVTARHSSSRHQPNFATLNRGRHPYSAGRPSRWAFAHILVFKSFTV